MTRKVWKIAGVTATQYEDDRVAYITRAHIDADGANGLSRHPLSGLPLFAYAPGDTGLDSLPYSAGYPSTSWWRDILVNTDDAPEADGKGNGEVVTFNGGYYSKTAWVDRTKSWNDPSRYLDACTIPYIVVPPQIRKEAHGIVLGCAARISFRNLTVNCIVGDIGPHSEIGEVSIAAAERVDLNSSPRHGGTEHMMVLYELWPGKPAVVSGHVYELIRYGG